MLFSDITEIKALLQIDPLDKSEDIVLNFCNKYASQWIGELLDRPQFGLQQRTEYYGGTGTQKLILRNRPAYVRYPVGSTDPTIQVFQDPNGYWGSTSGAFTASNAQLTYGTDFALKLDQPDGNTSRSAILQRINGYWSKPFLRQAGLLTPFVPITGDGNIKVIYWAGYTVDTLPAPFRMAAFILIAKMRDLLPLGTLLSSESYEDRSISKLIPQKRLLLDMVWPMIHSYRNWHF